MSRSSLPMRLRVLGAGLASTALLAAAAGPADAASCGAADASPTQASRQAVARATLCLINAERTAHSLRALQPRPSLDAAARDHTRDMIRRGYFSHTAPGGKGVVTRVRRSGYLRSAHRWRLGENLGWGSREQGSARAIVRAWMNSPPHRKAILSPRYRDAGVGVTWGVPHGGGAGGATYTVDFGTRG